MAWLLGGDPMRCIFSFLVKFTLLILVAHSLHQYRCAERDFTLGLQKPNTNLSRSFTSVYFVILFSVYTSRVVLFSFDRDRRFSTSQFVM